jgi:shikimate kinase/3-dehydroquinate synthase
MSLDTFFLYGPPGSGKTALGQRLADRLALPSIDLDARIVEQAGRSIPEIFAAEGESGFRQREREALGDALKEPGGVVALGGGALLDPEDRRQVEAAGEVLCLDASFEVLAARLQGEPRGRPLLAGDPLERLQALLAGRRDHYASFSHRLDASMGSIDELAWDAQVKLGAFHVKGMGAGYDVRIVEREPWRSREGLAALGAALRRRGLDGPLALVTDENVGPLYKEGALTSLRKAGYKVEVIALPAGEAHKSITSVIRLWDSFLQIGLERSSTVVALGGGVVGDLAGFAAAAYLRGVRWVAVPTSLLAMVDASLGGKTGIDLPQGKNLVGAFHPPSLVLADPRLLSTLPESELRSGLAEVVKHGVIGDAGLFELCQRDLSSLSDDLDEIVRRAMAVKIAVIEGDPYETGRRASLNLGHTLGHALERASDFRLKHGEAVSIGMVFAARLSERLGLASQGLAAQIAETLAGLGLPVALPPALDREQVLRAMAFDKKRRDGVIRFVLPVEIGEVRWGVEVKEDLIDSLLNRSFGATEGI